MTMIRLLYSVINKKVHFRMLVGAISCSVLVLALWCGSRAKDYALYSNTYLNGGIAYQSQNSIKLIAEAINKQISMDSSLICVDRYNPKPLPSNIDSISENAKYFVYLILPDDNDYRYSCKIELTNSPALISFLTSMNGFTSWQEFSITKDSFTEIRITSFDGYYEPDIPVDKQKECMRVFEKFIDYINVEQNINIQTRYVPPITLVLLEVAMRWPSEFVVHACNRDNGDN